MAEKLWTRGDAEAEIERVLKGGLTTRALAEVIRAANAIKRVGETSGRDDVAHEGLQKLQGLLPAIAPPSAPEWIELVCGSCGFARGVRCGEPADGCPQCRALRAEARLVPGKRDDWWIETMRKGDHVAAQLAREGHDGWDCLPFSADHFEDIQCVHIIERAQILFRGEYLVVDPETADGCLLDLKIGPRSQLINSSPIPLSVFNPKNWGSLDAMREAARLKLNVADVAQDITLVIRMRNPGPFRATLWGRSERF